jgi:hypothetical protein
MPELTEIEEAINGAQEVSARHVLLEVEGVEELVLPAALPTHHGAAPSLRRTQLKRDQCLFFNEVDRQSPKSALRLPGGGDAAA